MSLKAMNWVRKQKMKASRKQILMELANLADERNSDGLLCYPSTAYLVWATCLDRKTVLASLDEMKGTYIEETGEKIGRTNRVKILRLIISADQMETVPKTGPLNSPKNGTISDEAVPKTGPLNSPKNGTIKQSQKRDTETLKRKPNKETLLNDHFQIFISAYPNPVGSYEAEKIWRREKLDDQASEIMAGLELYKQTKWKGDGIQYVLNVDKFLSEKRWLDKLDLRNQFSPEAIAKKFLYQIMNHCISPHASNTQKTVMLEALKTLPDFDQFKDDQKFIEFFKTLKTGKDQNE